MSRRVPKKYAQLLERLPAARAERKAITRERQQLEVRLRLLARKLDQLDTQILDAEDLKLIDGQPVRWQRRSWIDGTTIEQVGVPRPRRAEVKIGLGHGNSFGRLYQVTVERAGRQRTTYPHRHKNGKPNKARPVTTTGGSVREWDAGLLKRDAMQLALDWVLHGKYPNHPDWNEEDAYKIELLQAIAEANPKGRWSQKRREVFEAEFIVKRLMEREDD